MQPMTTFRYDFICVTCILNPFLLFYSVSQCYLIFEIDQFMLRTQLFSRNEAFADINEIYSCGGTVRHEWASM